MTRHWLELGNQWLEVTRKFLWLASDSTRKNFRWLWLEGLVTLTGQKWLGHITVHWYSSEVAVVTFSDSKSTPFLKFFNPVPGPDREILQIWKSDSCSDSSYHRCNQNLSMFFLKKWPSVQIPASAEIENCFGSGTGSSQTFDSGSGSLSEKNAESCWSRFWQPGSMTPFCPGSDWKQSIQFVKGRSWLYC